MGRARGRGHRSLLGNEVREDDANQVFPFRPAHIARAGRVLRPRRRRPAPGHHAHRSGGPRHRDPLRSPRRARRSASAPRAHRVSRDRRLERDARVPGRHRGARGRTAARRARGVRNRQRRSGARRLRSGPARRRHAGAHRGDRTRRGPGPGAPTAGDPDRARARRRRRAAPRDAATEQRAARRDFVRRRKSKRRAPVARPRAWRRGAAPGAVEQLRRYRYAADRQRRAAARAPRLRRLPRGGRSADRRPLPRAEPRPRPHAQARPRLSRAARFLVARRGRRGARLTRPGGAPPPPFARIRASFAVSAALGGRGRLARGRDAAMTTLARAAALGALLLAFLPAFGQQPAGKPRALPTEAREWKGDFDGMIEHRHVRVLVPYSRTLYFNDKGRERGITADFVRDFERYINKKYAKQLGKRPITVYIIPTTRDELFTDVADGFGDIAAGNLTVTEERKNIVDFFAPGDFKVSEIVVTGPKSPPIATTDDLAGKTVHVRMASSYYQSLVALNERFKKEGKPAVKLTLVPDALEDEDMMEMLNAGVLEAIVVDDWKAKIWAAILPKIKVNDQAVVHAGGTVGWGFRKGSPKLQEILQDFYASYVKKQNLVQARLKQY